MKRHTDSGVILVNVLVALALGAALVTLMLTAQDVELDRARRAAALTQADAIARGAETSVVTALARDMVEWPDADHLAEPWASVAQQEVALGPGRFAVTLRDAQARLNLNGLADGGLAAQQSLLRLVTILGLPTETATAIAGSLAQRGALTGLDDIPALPDSARAALSPHIAFLPSGTLVNVNTAGPEVLAAVIGSAAAAARLIEARIGNGGFLTPGDLTDAGVLGIPGADFTSDIWDAEILVEVDGVTLILTSRILRLREIGRTDVRVISRRFGPLLPAAIPAPDAGLWLD